MRNFAYTSRRVLVSPLALLLVGFSCARVLASTEIDVTSVTNRLFTDYDEMVSFCDDQIYNVDWLTNRIAEIDGDLDDDLQSINNIIASVDTALHSMEVDGLQGTAAYNAIDSARDQLMDLEDRHDEFSDTIEDTRTVLLDVRRDINYYARTAPTYQIVVDGYEAPDYTRVLSAISNDLHRTYTYITNHWYEDITWTVDMIWNFMTSGDYATGHEPQERYEGMFLGKYFGLALSNSWDLVYYLNRYANAGNYQNGYGILNDLPVGFGPLYLQEIWNYILTPFARTWADDAPTDNRMISGFRDFFIGDHVVAVTNEPSNPVWVAFTNSVSLSEDTLLALTNKLFSLWDLMDSLTNATLSVRRSEDTIREELEVEFEVVGDAAQQAEAENSDPDEDTVALPTSDISTLGAVGHAVARVYTSYKSMFEVIPNTLPDDIMIHQGWVLRTPGSANDFEVESIHWRPGDYTGLTRLLSGIRGCFSALWVLLFVLVIWASLAIDLFVAGVCIYCTYGLLLGKPEVAVRGIRYMFGVLCSMLGREPPQ